MALSFSTALASAKFIPRGSVQVWYGPKVDNGADSSPLTWLGSRSAKLTLNFARKTALADVQEFFNALDAMVVAEELKFTSTYNKLTAANYQELLGMPSLPLTGGGDAATSATLGIGEDDVVQFRQIALRSNAPPSMGAGVKEIVQLWKVFSETQGAQDYAKEAFRTLQVGHHALADETAVSAGKRALGQYLYQ